MVCFLFSGNKFIATILREGFFELRIDMKDFDGFSRFVKYESVDVEEEAYKYRMHIYGYSGNTGNINEKKIIKVAILKIVS
jgi:hypothetical protein